MPAPSPDQGFTDNHACPQIIGQCPTECSYDDGTVNFTVRCTLDAGHGGRHRGSAVVEFALIFVSGDDDDEIGYHGVR